jgi:hypothetical protein
MRESFDKAGKSVGDTDGDKRETEKNHKHQGEVKNRCYDKIEHDGPFL